ncbi:hypothetical protein CENSYa_0487 [Cenarchaeum symbiosum A]|uniref:Uncharacterized protein n=1 Tax=Cenarchaeum symbiosum (strain A) TaxID=414004 RepID=A0RUV4_CENSY|nr:hypothetical protein CENSYa_0487 [Cenarchaeum symbiosum A]
MPLAASAQELRFATFQETAQVLVDAGASNVTASVTLQSTSEREMKVPPEIADRITGDENIASVVLTNEDVCVLGVSGESCILVNVARNPDWGGISGTQEAAKIIGDSLIGELNDFFDTQASFHSVFLHHSDDVNVAFDTSGAVSGRGTVSAVYTMPREATDSMYEKISALLLSQEIRASGGFYDAARGLAADESSSMSFAIIRGGPLYQLKVSLVQGGSPGDVINPLEYLQAETLHRSEHFSGGFFPLNSIVQVAVIGKGGITGVSPGLVDFDVVEDTPIPTDLTQTGWIDQSAEGAGEMVFLFGERNSVGSGELAVMLGENPAAPPRPGLIDGIPDESLVVLIIAVAGASGAAALFLRGYKRAPGSRAR